MPRLGLLRLQDGQRRNELPRDGVFCGRRRASARGQRLAGKASAAIDVSDGLAGDLGKLLAASGVGGEIDLEKLPLSAALREGFDADTQRRLALTGGDDYELCFTARRGCASWRT